MIIRLSGGIVVPPMCRVTHELGLLDAITHGRGYLGGLLTKVWPGHPVVMVNKDGIGEIHGQLFQELSYFTQ